METPLDTFETLLEPLREHVKALIGERDTHKGVLDRTVENYNRREEEHQAEVQAYKERIGALEAQLAAAIARPEE